MIRLEELLRAFGAVMYPVHPRSRLNGEDILMWESLEHMGWVTFLATTGWLYGAVSVVHYFTLFFFIGTIVLVDLRIIGIAGRNQTISLLADQLLPWTWIGFMLAMVSGILLFATDAGDYAPDHVFRAKMLVILLAVILTVIVHRGQWKWSQLPVVPLTAKLIAVASLLLWLGAILAGVDIAALSGLG